jgi:hypothetical protein
MMGTNTDNKTGALTNAVLADIRNRLDDALHVITQANCSMGAIAKDLPPIDDKDGVISAELVIPLLVQATKGGLRQCYQILEELEVLAGV